MSKNKYWIALSSMEEIDSRFVQRLYNYFGDIETAYKACAKDLSQIDGLNIKKAETFIQKRDKTNPEKVLDEIIRRNLSFITFEDENYPYMLKNISDPPMVLYVKGDLGLCNLERTLAIVGSRKASTNAKDVLTKIIAELRNTDVCIVSGLASGIDTTAHNAALANNLKTIGVIASGFDFVYPSANKELYKKITDGNGAILSEYFPTFQPLQFRFPHRNRIVSGLSYGTLVAEAAIRSGALITANLCLEHGRELMCIPGLVSNPNTQGVYKLLKQGAAMVTCAEDILETLKWEIQSEKQLKMDFSQYSNDEKKILSSIEIEPKGFDAISAETSVNFNDLLFCLTNLELQGAIKQIDGEKYKII
ncbi:MAG: DNA-processing protein DprA [Candidatus Gastranaerophilales bacterium]|nr:DNA-processing protein DprA [Candidatus Gastranaerophilales bacterium]